MSTGNPSLGKSISVDANALLWIGGILVALALLAVKAGLGLERGAFCRRQVLTICAMYVTAFLGAACLAALVLLAVSHTAMLQDAGQVYASFVADGAEVDTGHGPGVWLMFAAIACLGNFARARLESR